MEHIIGDHEETISPDDPRFADALAAFHQQAAPEMPVIDVATGPGNIKLVHGLRHDGVIYTTAIVRELRGSDEEALARLSPTSDDYFMLMTDLILQRAVLSIGPLQIKDDPSVLSKLVLADRDALFIGILLATYGEDKTYEEVECDTCKAKNDIDIHIPGIIKTRDADSDTVEIVLRNKKKAVFRWPNGADQMYSFAAKKNASLAERNTFVIEKCIISVDGLPVPSPRQFAQEMNIADRKKVISVLADEGPSITFDELTVECPHCGSEIKIGFGWADLLFL